MTDDELTALALEVQEKQKALERAENVLYKDVNSGTYFAGVMRAIRQLNKAEAALKTAQEKREVNT